MTGGSATPATARQATLEEGLFDPRSVAVVGASADPRKWGHWLAKGALAGRHRRRVAFVNRRGSSVLGMGTVRRISELETVPELVLVTTPASSVQNIVREGLEMGSRHFVVITAGLSEPSPSTGKQQLVELVRSAGARLLGPNCMGLVDTDTDLRLSWGEFPRGSVGLVSQSGNVGLELSRMLADVGHGFSRFVSLGDQYDIEAAEAVETLVQHKQTRLIAVYVEDFGDGRRLARALRAAREAGKPVLVLTVGGSEASTRAARSHTGAMVSGLDVVTAMCESVGAVRVGSTGELVDTVQVLLASARVRGRRVALLADSGGHGGLGADTMVDHGLEVPPLDEMVVQQLASVLPSHAGLSNPVDLAGAGEEDLQNYPYVAALLQDAGTDVTVLTGYFGDYSTGDAGQLGAEVRAAQRLAEQSARSGHPVIVHSMGRETPPLAALRRRGVPVLERIEHVAAAVANAAQWWGYRPQEPRQAPTLESPDRDAVRMESGDYPVVRDLLRRHGVRFPEAGFFSDEAEGLASARSLGYPVVLKAMGLLHKTEAGGVRLGIGDDRAFLEELRMMRSRTRASAYAVERMESHEGAVELIMGVRRDPAFGPVVMVGLGGTAAELLADRMVALAPVDVAQARALISSLRQAPLLTGWRGSAALDLDAAAQTLTAIALAFCSHPELVELEVNPVLVLADGALALDGVAMLSRAIEADQRRRS